MNKRILLALYDRSGLGAYMPVDYKGHELAVAEHMEKFAELIVQECCHIMNTTAKKAEESNTYMGDDVPTRVHQYTIKQHFGVKE